MKWLNSKEISLLADNCGMDKAREILKKANERVTGSGCIVINKKKAPMPIVLELLGMTEIDVVKNFELTNILAMLKNG